MTSPDQKLSEELAEACVVLGIVPPVRMDEVKSRYRTLAKLYHPDVGQRRNEEDFSRITRAYELIESHPDILTTASLTIGSKDPGGRLATLANELRESKTRTVNAEAAARRLAEEANATRQYLNATKRKGRSWIFALLACAAGLALGFIAGTVWTYKSPIGKTNSNLSIHATMAPFTALASENGTTETILLHGKDIPVQIELQNPHIQVELKDGVAHLDIPATPTLKILQPQPSNIKPDRSGTITGLFPPPQ